MTVFLISVPMVGSKFTNQISPRLGIGLGFNQVFYLKVLPFGIVLVVGHQIFGLALENLPTFCHW
jgi:hypothetical protein